MNYSLPQNIQSIIAQLNRAGFSAHVVGGCVRDLVLGRVPQDWDVTTSAPPDKIKEVFKRSYDTGLKHGTVTVLHEGALCEITTWRKESTYQDHRRPDRVVFTASLEEDLTRRDFTMNAMAWHPVEGLIDLFGGLEDIKAKTIRCVGDPNLRFSEDALRMLRAIRFSAQLGFHIEEGTFEAIVRHSQDIRYVSAERIQVEMNKILESSHPDRFGLIWKTGLGSIILPDIPSLPEKWLDIAAGITGLSSPVPMLWGLLFLLMGETPKVDFSERILKILKYDNATLRAVRQLLLAYEDLATVTARNIRKAMGTHGTDAATQALQAKSLMGLPTLDTPVDPAICQDSFNQKLDISGLALESLGFSGKEIGQVLSVLSLCIYEKPECNVSELLMHLTRFIRNKIMAWQTQ